MDKDIFKKQLKESLGDRLIYIEDKISKHAPIMDCLSDCCGSPCNSDYMICMDCGEHCEIYYEDDEE